MLRFSWLQKKEHVRKHAGARSRVRVAAVEADDASRVRFLTICVLLAALLALSAIRTAHAVMEELSLEALTVRADRIVHGTVQAMKSTWDDDRTMVYTQIVVRIANQIKGKADGKEVIVQIPGGVVDDVGLAVSDVPEFTVGEEVMLFLGPGEAGQFEVTGWWQGKYHVESGWAYTEGMKQPLKLRDLMHQVLDIMTAHDIPTTLEPDWEQRLPQASATPPELGHVALAAYVYNGLKWPDPNPMGENYLVNTNIVDDDVNSSQALAAVQAAASTWNAVPTSYFVFSYGGSTSATDRSFNNVNEITWLDRGQIGVLATTYYWYNPSTGIIVESDQVVNDSYNWDVTGSPSGGEFDLQSVLLHEFGHYLSLGHDDSSSAVMYYAISAGTVKRTLHQNDVDGISFIYPAAVTPTATPTPTPSSTATATPTGTATTTATPTPTPSATSTPTHTPTPSSTSTDTPTPSPSPTETTGVPCPIPGDVDNSTVVDLNDVARIAERWRTTSGGPGGNPGGAPYESAYDLDLDLDVDIVDVMAAAAAWGNTCQPAAPTETATPTATATPTEAAAPLAGAARGAPIVWPAVLAVVVLVVLVGALLWRGTRQR